MKKSFILGMVLFLAFGLAVNAHALLTHGTYDLLSGLGNGSWIEIFNWKGGAPESTFIGAATNSKWLFTGTLSSFNGASPPWQNQSTGQINLAIVAPGAWGEAVQISNVSGTKLSKVESGKLEWHLTFTGYDNENPSIPINFTAHFDNITPTPGSGVTYFDMNPFMQGGSTLSQLDMQIAAPIPAAAWLLGSGLIGLAVIRRRFNK
jgi:hypothetical protein